MRRSLRSSHRLVATVLVLCLAAPWPLLAEAAPAGASYKAKDLLEAADKALSRLVEVARGAKDPLLDPEKDEAKPFWRALKGMNEALAKAERGLFLKDETFFNSLAAAETNGVEARIALTMSGSENALVAEALGDLNKILEAIQKSYGVETQRLEKGGELSAEERAQLEKMKAQQADIEKRLDEVERKVGNNKAAIEGLREIRQQVRTVHDCHFDVGGFVAASIATRLISGLIWGWHWWWGPWGAWAPGWININIGIWYDWVAVVPYDWAIVDTYADLAVLEDLAILDDLETLEALDTLETLETLEALDDLQDLADLEALADLEYLADDAVIDSFLDEASLDLTEEDLIDLSSELDVGWDDLGDTVTDEVLDEVMDEYVEDFATEIYEEAINEALEEAVMESFVESLFDEF